MKLMSLADITPSPVSHTPQIKKRIMIHKGELKHITNFSQAVIPAGEIADSHVHKDMTEVFWVQSGEGVIRIDGTEYQFLPGVCVMVSPCERHEIQNTGSSDLIILYFGVET